MEKIAERGLLYDFYGELLTKHQHRVCEGMMFGNLFLSEMVGEQGISRQGTHDSIKRCDKILKGYEVRFRLVAKFMKIREMVSELERLSDGCTCTKGMVLIDQIRRSSTEIISML